MIEAAHEAGADAVKLQTLIPEEFVSPRFPERLGQMRRFALSIDDTLDLIDSFGRRGILVFSTPLDLISARELASHVSLFKVSSGDLTWTELLTFIGQTGKDVILSTGMAYLSEVGEAVALLSEIWGDREPPALALLHCVSEYPASPNIVNLAAMVTMRAAFPSAAVGYSDHAMGLDVATTAVAAGARIIEKHFTLDKNQSDFRDHALSADPAELTELRARIDAVCEQLGSPEKRPTEAEVAARLAIRRSVTVREHLATGHVIAADDLLCQRPGDGLPPSALDAVIGRSLRNDVDAGHLLQHEDLA
jgi:N,N'-diacetyllegionaminate synthase